MTKIFVPLSSGNFSRMLSGNGVYLLGTYWKSLPPSWKSDIFIAAEVDFVNLRSSAVGIASVRLIGLMMCYLLSVRS
jgi:hypothetical protein